MHDPHPDLTRAYLAACDAGNTTEADHLAALIDRHAQTDADAQRARLDAPDALGRAAAYYAAHGLPVFPLKPGEKTPATAHGFHDATTNPDRVGAWWRATPDANIGTPTGPTTTGGCGYDVIDLDGREGVASWYGIAPEPGDPPILARSRTTRPGGWHLWITATGRGNRTRMTPGIDYRGRGGYVVLPPSINAERGRRYRWAEVLPALVGRTTEEQ